MNIMNPGASSAGPWTLISPKAAVLDEAKRRHDLPTDEQLAQSIGVSLATYTRVKCGELAPSPVFMAGLVRLTGRTLGQLFEVRVTAVVPAVLG